MARTVVCCLLFAICCVNIYVSTFSIWFIWLVGWLIVLHDVIVAPWGDAIGCIPSGVNRTALFYVLYFIFALYTVHSAVIMIRIHNFLSKLIHWEREETVWKWKRVTAMTWIWFHMFHFLFYYFLFFSTGAFLVPYILMVLVIGLPIFFAELFVGQYSGLGPIRAYEYLAPIFHGK